MEPFAGSLAVLFAKPPVAHEIVNDADRAVVTFFRVLRERPAELEEVCALTPHARVEFELADMDGECDELELARRFWVRVNQSFAKTAGRNTGWTITTARTQSVPGTILGRLGRFAPCAERLARGERRKRQISRAPDYAGAGGSDINRSRRKSPSSPASNPAIEGS